MYKYNIYYIYILYIYIIYIYNKTSGLRRMAGTRHPMPKLSTLTLLHSHLVNI